MSRGRKYRLTEQQAYDWVVGFESARNYLGKLNSHQVRAGQNLWHFCEWAKLNPDELLVLKSGFDNLDAERLLDRFVCAVVALPESTKWLVTQTVRGFFTRNYRMLQSEAGKMEYVPRKPKRVISKAQRLDLYRACYNPRDRALIMMGCCSSIAVEGLSMSRWSYFEDDWRRQDVPALYLPSSIVKGHGKGRYRNVEQVPFITPECKRVLLEYRDWYAKTFLYRWHDSDHIFLSVKNNVGEPLKYDAICNAVFEISRRAGVRFGIHDGRTVVQTALESVGVSPQWIRKVKGRKVRGEESPYSRPAVEQLRLKYREALGELEFLGAGEPAASPRLSAEKLQLIEDFVAKIKSGEYELKRKSSL